MFNIKPCIWLVFPVFLAMQSIAVNVAAQSQSVSGVEVQVRQRFVFEFPSQRLTDLGVRPGDEIRQIDGNSVDGSTVNWQLNSGRTISLRLQDNLSGPLRSVSLFPPYSESAEFSKLGISLRRLDSGRAPHIAVISLPGSQSSPE